MSAKNTNLLAQLDNMTTEQLRRLLVEQLTQKKLGLNWESNAIERDAALNANIVLPRLVPECSHNLDSSTARQLDSSTARQLDSSTARLNT